MSLVQRVLDGLQTRRATFFQPVSGKDPSGQSQVLAVGSDGTLLTAAPGFALPNYDTIVLGYTGDATEPTSVTYKRVGVTVATLTISYDGNGRTWQIAKS